MSCNYSFIKALRHSEQTNPRIIKHTLSVERCDSYRAQERQSKTAPDLREPLVFSHCVYKEINAIRCVSIPESSRVSFEDDLMWLPFTGGASEISGRLALEIHMWVKPSRPRQLRAPAW